MTKQSLLQISTLALLLSACGNDQNDPTPLEQEIEERTAPCVYPESSGFTGVGSILPELSWEASAGLEDGLSVKDVYCAGEYKSIVFVLTADWCPNCPAYLNHVTRSRVEMERNGALVVFVGIQNEDSSSQNTEGARSYLFGKLDEGYGHRFGDGSASPQNFFQDAEVFSYMPNAVVVRTSDMLVVATQEQSAGDTWLNFAGVTGNIDAVNPADIPATCGPSDEEDSEPNNNLGQMHVLSEGVSVQGGICTDELDAYRVNLEGQWTVNLDFLHSDGDLEVVVVDDAGQGVTGVQSYSDNETLTWTGPANLVVFGYVGATAPYTLTLNR